MRVLHYIDCDSMSWMAAYIEHIRLLRDMGAEPVLLCRPGGDAERVARENGVPVRTWRPLIAAAPRLSPGFAGIVRSVAPDIIHTRLSSAARIAGFYGKRLGVPTVATFDKPAKGKYYMDIDRYISCAEWLKRHMIQVEGLDSDKIDVVHNSVDIGRFARDDERRRETRAALGLSSDEILFSGMGIYIHRKGFDVLIRAFAKLCSARGGKLRLTLIGGGGERGMREKYLDLARGLGVAERLIMPEKFLTDARPWLWASDVFVMPSRAEGFSIALLEGMASGLPVIASDIEPFTEIVRNGFSGLIAAKDDAEDFARAMERMLDIGTAGRTRLVQSALNVLERDFTPGAAAEKTLAIYHDILDSGS